MPAFLLGLPLWWASDNVHSAEESAASDRLYLAFRTFWGEGPSHIAGALQPLGWTPDPNYALGTPFLFLPAHLLPGDPTTWARAFAFAAAVVASLAASRLGGRLLGPIGTAAGLLLWGVPAFLRGAVVSGEEAFAAATVLVGLGLLARNVDDPTLRGPSLVVGASLTGAAALLRLDALPLALGLAALGAVALRGRRGAIWLALCALPVIVHLGVAASVSGDPFAFADSIGHQAQAVAHSGEDFGGSALWKGWLAELGWGGLGLTGLGIAVLWRRPGSPRLVAAAITLALAVDAGLVLMGVMQPRFARYFVPAFSLASLAWPAAVVQLAPYLPRAARTALPALCGLLFAVFGGLRARDQSRTARLPEGLLPACRWLRNQEPGTVVVSGQHPEFAVRLGWGGGAIHPAGPVQDRTGLVRVLTERGARWVVLLPDDDATRVAHPRPANCEQVWETSGTTIWSCDTLPRFPVRGVILPTHEELPR